MIKTTTAPFGVPDEGGNGGVEKRSHHNFINRFFFKNELLAHYSASPQTAQPLGRCRPPTSFAPPLPPSERSLGDVCKILEP